MKLLEDVFSLIWVPHHSSFIGNYYRSGRMEAEHFELQYNYSDEDQDWDKPEFKEFTILLYVNRTERSNEIEKLIVGKFGDSATLLSRNIYTD